MLQGLVFGRWGARVRRGKIGRTGWRLLLCFCARYEAPATHGITFGRREGDELLGFMSAVYARRHCCVSACLSALAVASSGRIGFIGPVAPHIERNTVGGRSPPLPSGQRVLIGGLVLSLALPGEK